jgi:uncharacterized protein (DUF488 family)
MSVFYTIGHSTRSIPDFVRLLQDAGSDLVVDVRTVPRSRANPQFNHETLPEALAAHGIAYRHLRALGGLRGRSRQVAPAANAFWENESFRNFADYATTAEFRAGLEELRRLGQRHVCAVMCAEAVWWRCHRRIIADYLIAAGETVRHITGPRRIDTAELSSAAVAGPNGVLTYPAPATPG